MNEFAFELMVWACRWARHLATRLGLPGLQPAAATADRVSLRKTNLRRVRKGFLVDGICTGGLLDNSREIGAADRKVVIGTLPYPSLFVGRPKEMAAKIPVGSLMPRYLAPQEANWTLQSGPLPQQTMSGGLGGVVWFAVCAGIVGLVVVCAAVEAKAAGNRRTAIMHISPFPIGRNLLRRHIVDAPPASLILLRLSAREIRSILPTSSGNSAQFTLPPTREYSTCTS